MRREYVRSQSRQLNAKLPEPSTKKGRRSWKNVSNAPRFTTAGSASTWPKSGLTVAVNVNAGVTAYFRSTPIDAPGSVVFCSGLPSSGGTVATCDTAYGTSSSRFGVRLAVRPVSSPNDDTYPLALFASSGHVDVSLSRATSRTTANPTRPSPRRLNRSCENGMWNSARQPSASRFTTTSHTASQLRSALLSLNQ